MKNEELKADETMNRNYLKETKPLVYEKVMKFKEKYERGESIAIIQLQYDYHCNMKCEHCSIKDFQKPKNARKLTPKDVADIARQADELGLARFVISGGEPTVFPDLKEIVEAINPQKFFINSDSNGFLLAKRAKELKEMGIDRIQLSIDSLDAKAHDEFRRMPGAYEKALEGIEACKKVGLGVYVQTVVTKQRLHSEEFIEFIKYFNGKGINVFVSFAKPVGAWAGNFDSMIDRDDLKFMNELEKKYKVFTHLTPGYGLDMGCISVKGMISITEYGDVLPCPYIHTSIGNVFETPLKDIIQKGLSIKYFGEHVDTCLIAEDKEWVKKYVAKHIYNHDLPVPCDEVFGEEDVTKIPFYKR